MNECAPVTQVQVGSLLFFMINDDDDVTQQHSNDDERKILFLTYVTPRKKFLKSFILFLNILSIYICILRFLFYLIDLLVTISIQNRRRQLEMDAGTHSYTLYARPYL